MSIRELTIDEFNAFVRNSPLGTHYQTFNYALLMGENGYEYELVGMFNEYNQLKAASLILFKNLKMHYKYGYAPKGFILDYFNQEIVSEFATLLKSYYKKKKVVFIKINPEIAISEIDKESGLKTYNWNYNILEIMEKAGFKKLKDNLYFESVLPRFSAVVSLKNYSMNSVSKNTRNKIRRAHHKGLHIELAEKSGIDILQKFIKNKRTINEYYYKDYYNVFKKDDMIDLFLVSIDSEEFLMNSRELYEKELEINNRLVSLLNRENNKRNLNKKMDSDRKILNYKQDVKFATELNTKKDKVYIAGALVIKYQNRVQILMSGYDKKYKRFEANYYLHDEILKYYQKNYDYAELNGLTGDFSKENPYLGLNEFKIGFNPRIYEYIGEFDLPLNEKKYLKMRSNGELAKIFNKPNQKVKKVMREKND
ncbi:peptidoglycan bridge formation glycyltransferase FemA/FemB family protein [bacterium]|nr:peptidoglycan bridge formation glycyltransferase FemA/FemB family protein [bacterium]